jgi:hypothetical protein
VTGAAGEVGEEDRNQRPEQPGAHPVQDLDAHQPNRIVGERIEHAADGQYRESDQAERLTAKAVTVAGEITAIGSITSCAAITQADISAVASLL